ncbi:Protein of unknown function DUF91 [Verrucomicrobium sp. GAS474]|uniref:endonuclease NucS domain-containing protein n=1 Tax=Verrucomicrobium sp. GAS474 TaxID=1882831 RepID=UPI00087C2DD8|nr:endonuclease NucS domain-containing protein [Verrucomicrobium sp. GAS474]SDT96742.1 Protein of unknown function DUF91 [Verrucomicrobium sp. GAS474]
MSALVSAGSFRRRLLERTIEDVLFAYPYLVSPGLSRPERQEVLGKNSRSDLAFYEGKQATVVEIKRNAAGLPALRQLERYVKEKTRQGFEAKGILVAASFTPSTLKAAAKSKGRLACRRLHDEVPVEITICKKCRKARDRRIAACPDDKSRETLGTPGRA